MKAEGQIRIRAGELQRAAAIVPVRLKKSQRGKPWPVTLTFDPVTSLLEVTEARYELRSYRVPAAGEWPYQVQVDGRALRAMAGAYHGNAMLDLVVSGDELCILYETSVVRLPRLDGVGKPGVKRQPLPANRRHKGAVVMPPDFDPNYKRVELDATWTFSARMPVPQHRERKN